MAHEMTDYEALVETAARAYQERITSGVILGGPHPAIIDAMGVALSAVGLTSESVIVPREPTEAMLDAGGQWSAFPCRTYADMITAAPHVEARK